MFNYFTLTLLSFSIFASEPQAKPVLYLFERDPWLMVIGSDSPIFCLYDDGSVIVATESKNLLEGFKKAQWDSEKVAEFLKDIDFEALNKNHGTMVSASDYTDQPRNELIFQYKGEMKITGVYGALGGEAREAAPKAFFAVYDKIKSLKLDDAEIWLPEKIEVMIWPYEYSPEEPLIWPQGWPDLNDKATEKRGDSYSLFLEKEKFVPFLELYVKRRQKQALLINEKKWAVAFRIPFPGL